MAANGAGAALVRATHKGLPGVELDEREEALLAAQPSITAPTTSPTGAVEVYERVCEARR